MENRWTWHKNSITVSNWITHHSNSICHRQHRITPQRYITYNTCKSLCIVNLPLPLPITVTQYLLLCVMNGRALMVLWVEKKEEKELIWDARTARASLAKQICFYRATLVNYFRPDSWLRKGRCCEWLYVMQPHQLPELMQPLTLAPSQHLVVWREENEAFALDCCHRYASVVLNGLPLCSETDGLNEINK